MAWTGPRPRRNGLPPPGVPPDFAGREHFLVESKLSNDRHRMVCFGGSLHTRFCGGSVDIGERIMINQDNVSGA